MRYGCDLVKRTQRSRDGNLARVSSAAAIYQPKKKSRTSPSLPGGAQVPQLRAHATRATTQSGIQQDAMRRNQAEVGEESQQLRASVKDAKRGFTDDTGWRAFCTDIGESPKPQVTAYSLEVRKCRNCGRTLCGQHPQARVGRRSSDGSTLRGRGARLRSDKSDWLRERAWLLQSITVKL